MKSMQTHMRPAIGICSAMIVMLTTVSSFGSDIELTVTPMGPYYGDLPMYVEFAVTNRGTNDAHVWSVGRGSGAVSPGRMLANDGVPVCQPEHVSTEHWERIVRLPAGGKIIGRLCVSSWATPTNGVTGNEFQPGDYSVILRYRFGTNRGEVVSSSNIAIHVVDPDVSLEEARTNFRRVICELRESTNAVMSERLKRGNESDPYSVSALNRYAKWLWVKARHDEALSVWQKVLDAGDSHFRDIVTVKFDMACCYLALKRQEDARRILEGIKRESDAALGLLWKLDKKEGPPIDVE